LLTNVASAAGSAAPVRPPRFYAGEDLSIRQEGVCANRWAFALVHLQRDELLLGLLGQLSAAPHVPAPVLQLALEHGIRRHSDEILAAAAALDTRVIALTTEERQALDRWMARDEVRRARNRP
jgi:hypothetical protein